MKKVKRYRSNVRILLTALVLGALAITSVTRSATAFGDADLSAEARAIDSYGDALSSFNRKCAELDKKAALTRAEYRDVQNSGDDLKRRVSQAQQAFQSIISKLRAANQWNDYDAIALKKVNDRRVRDFLRSEGGPKRVLERAASEGGAISTDITASVERLRQKVREESGHFRIFEQERGRRLIPVSYTTAAPAVGAPAVAAGGGRCFFSKVRRFVSTVVNGGCASSESRRAECEACDISFADCSDCQLN